jgi:hypothetical protein
MGFRLARLGAPLAAAALLAACSSGPDPSGPLGNGGGAGQQCIPGREGRRPVTMGIFALENSSSSPVKVQDVTLPHARGLRMTKPWLIPVYHPPGQFDLVGVAYTYPPVTWPTWRYHRPADGATIAGHKTANLVFGLIRTTSRSGTSAGPAITYSSGGSSYVLGEQVSLVVVPAWRC